jgi:hypothetical protein
MGKAEFHAIDGADHPTTVTHPQFRESIRKFFGTPARKTDAGQP